MDWFLFSIISVIAGAIASILSRVLMKDQDSDPMSYAIVFQLLCTIFIFLFALWNGFVMPPIAQYPFNFLILAILYALGSVFILKAYQLSEASEVIIVTSSRAIPAIIAGMIVLGEIFTPVQALGAILIFVAIVLINLKNKRLKITKGNLYALAFAVCFGLAVVNDKYVMVTSQTEAISYTAVAFLLPTLLLIVTNPKSILKSKHFLKLSMLMKMVLLCVFYSISAICFYLAFQYGANASQLTPIAQSGVILTVILSAIFLNERD